MKFDCRYKSYSYELQDIYDRLELLFPDINDPRYNLRSITEFINENWPSLSKNKLNGKEQEIRNQKQTMTWSDLYNYNKYPRTVKSHKPSLQNFQSYLQKFINSPLFVNAKKTSTYIGNHIRNITSGDIFVIDIAMVSSIPQQSFIVGDVMKTLDDMFSMSSHGISQRQDRKMNSRGLKRNPRYILIFIDEINRFVPRTYEQLPGILNTILELFSILYSVFLLV